MSNKRPIQRVSTRRGFLAALPAVPLTASAAIRLLQRKVVYDFRAIRRTIAEAIAAGKATGIAVAAVHRGRIVWEEGFGWANREVGRRATARTPFSLASLSKPFTTTAVATLAEQGKLSLDQPVNVYLRDTPLRGAGADSATVRQLGAHAAGLPSLFEMYPTGSDPAAPSGAALLREYGSLVYPPGRVYEYSNIGYTALGAIASHLTGMDFGAFITNRVLEPLGLRDSFFDADTSALAHGAARYDELDRPIPYYTTATPPSGELYASAHDLALFGMFNLRYSTLSRHPVLAERWIAELHEPVLRGPGAGSTTFGWFAGRGVSGLPVLFKDGGQPGVSTIMYVVPSEDLACVVLTNRSDNGDLAQSLVDQTIAVLLPGWTTPDTRIAAPKLPFSGPLDWAGRWIGHLSGSNVDTEVSLEIRPDSRASLALGNEAAREITALGSEGQALVGRSTGTIDAPDVTRNRANTLSLKLFRDGRALRGRVLAAASEPGELATIPFAVSLERSRNFDTRMREEPGIPLAHDRPL